MNIFISKESENPYAIWGPDVSKPEDSWYQDKVQSVIRAIATHKELTPDFTILDIACGKGILDVEFSKAFPEAKITGVDLESYPEWKKLTSPNIRFEKGEMFTFLQTDTRNWDITLMLNILRLRAENPAHSELAVKTIAIWAKAHTKFLIFDYWYVEGATAVNHGLAYSRQEIGDFYLYEYKGRID